MTSDASVSKSSGRRAASSSWICEEYDVFGDQRDALDAGMAGAEEALEIMNYEIEERVLRQRTAS